MENIRKVFSERNFRIHTVGSIFSWLSFFVQLVAVSWLTWELTGSTTWLAVIAALDVVPLFLFGPYGSVLADRHDRVTIVKVTHWLALVQALALMVLALLDRLDILLLAALTFVHGTIHSFSVPALYGMLPRAISKENLSSAIAINSAYTQLAVFLGPAFAGFLLVQFNAGVAFGFNALGYGVYLVTVRMLVLGPAEKRNRDAGKGAWADYRAGLSYIRNHPGIGPLMALGMIGNMVSQSLRKMMPAHAETAFDGGVEVMSLLLSMAGAGATLGAVWLAVRSDRGERTDQALVGMLVAIVMAGLFLGASTLIVASIVILLFGIAIEIRQTCTVTLIQENVTDGMRGRVMGVYFLIAQGSGILGGFFVGTIAEYTGLTLPMMILLSLSMAGLIWLSLRRKPMQQALNPGRD